MNTELLEFPSIADPKVVIHYNRSSDKLHILHTPSPEELTVLIQKFEAQVLDRFWTKVVLPPSPYHETFPTGLACTQAGHAIISAPKLFESMTGKSVTTQTARGGIKEREAKAALRKHTMRELQLGLEKIKPKTVEEAQALFTVQGHRKFRVLSIAAVAKAYPNFEEFASRIWTLARLSKETRAPVSFLVEMRSQGWILCPTKITVAIGSVNRGRNMRADGIWDSAPIDHLCEPLADFYKQLMGDVTTWNDRNEQAREQTKCLTAVLCSTINHLPNFTWPVADEILSINARKSLSSTLRLRTHWRNLCETNGPEAMRLKKESNHREQLAQRCPPDPRLNKWIDVLATQCGYHMGGNLDPVYRAYGFWLKWLATLDTIPDPHDVQRQHIRNDRNPGANTFRNFVAKLEFEKQKQYNAPLLAMAHVFERMWTDAEKKGAEFQNPIRYKIDRFHVPSRREPGSTTRQRIENWILDELRHLIVTQTPGGGFAWTDTVTGMSLNTYRTAAGKDTFCPLRPAILYLMLVYPLRSHQVRWLDSGELDAIIYDFKSGKFCQNPNRINENRDAGLLRPSRKGNDIDFQVNTNKTVLSARRRSAFTIPYTNPECIWVIQQVLEWQKQYGPPPTLVKEVDEPVLRERRHKELEFFYPEICPLFRSREQESFYPPTTSQLKYFWGCLSAAWDEKNLHWRDPKTGIEMPRPGVPKLARVYERDGNTWDTSNYDLHSLRVAGVSSLLDSGMPLAMVAAIAGHKTLAMTLHYYKAEEESLRIALKDAFNKIGITNSLESVTQKLKEIDNLDEYQKWFQGNTPEALKALQQAKKNQAPRIFLSGICPGTSCDSGLPAEFKEVHGHSVPGARCPLCKYFVFGPAFLPGMIQEANCLLFELGDKANRQLALRQQAITAEDEGNFTDLNLLRHEEDRLDCETRLDLKVLARLHTMIEEALEMANANTPADGKGELIVQGNGQGELAVILEQVSKFSHWHDLVAMAEMMPASRQVVPDQAILRMQDKILGCLAKNGIQPFLLTLPEKAKKAAILKLADLLERAIPNEDQRDKILEGEVALSSQPALEQGLLKLMEETKAPLIPANPQPRLQSPS